MASILSRRERPISAVCCSSSPRCKDNITKCHVYHTKFGSSRPPESSPRGQPPVSSNLPPRSRREGRDLQLGRYPVCFQGKVRVSREEHGTRQKCLHGCLAACKPLRLADSPGLPKVNIAYHRSDTQPHRVRPCYACLRRDVPQNSFPHSPGSLWCSGLTVNNRATPGSRCRRPILPSTARPLSGRPEVSPFLPLLHRR